MLGTGEAALSRRCGAALAARHPDRIGVRIGFDEALAHLIEGGADMFLMPSRFEPCGLNQMYSLRYGTVPVVRAVGGLADTVRDYDAADARRRPASCSRDYTAGGAARRARRGRCALFADPARWRALQLAGMQQDFSWDRSAREYVKIYERAIDERGHDDVARRRWQLSASGSRETRGADEWQLTTCRPLPTAISTRR